LINKTIYTFYFRFRTSRLQLSRILHSAQTIPNFVYMLLNYSQRTSEFLLTLYQFYAI